MGTGGNMTLLDKVKQSKTVLLHVLLNCCIFALVTNI